MTAPVLDVHPPALLLLLPVVTARLLLGVQLSVDAGHQRRLQRDVAQLRRPSQAEHRLVQRRPERVQVPGRVTRREPDPEQLKARLRSGQHFCRLHVSANFKSPPLPPLSWGYPKAVTAPPPLLVTGGDPSLDSTLL